MQINYKTKKLKKQLTSEREMLKAYGQRAKKLNQRLGELKAANNLKEISLIPPLRLHPYKGSRKGEWSIDIKDNWRILFVIDKPGSPENGKVSLDLGEITIIKITSIEDPH